MAEGGTGSGALALPLGEGVAAARREAVPAREGGGGGEAVADAAAEGVAARGGEGEACFAGDSLAALGVSLAAPGEALAGSVMVADPQGVCDDPPSGEGVAARDAPASP